MFKLFYIFILLLSIHVFIYANVINDNEIDMVYIKSGDFLMGSVFNSKMPSDKDEMPAFMVSISGFYMGKYEISYGQWKYIYDWAITNGYDFDNSGRAGASYSVIVTLGEENDSGTGNKSHPVVGISWYDIIKWCNAKSEMDGLTPIYYIDSMKQNVYRKGIVDVTVTMVLWNGDGYRLPTEAEWEYAARAGSKTVFPWGNSYREMYKYANSLDITASSFIRSKTYIRVKDMYTDTAPVYVYMPNDFGIYNMIGNVWEWVFDFYGPYRDVHKKNPKGESRGYKRVIRGGSFYTSFVEGLKSANRYEEAPTLSDSFTGFRIVKNR